MKNSFFRRLNDTQKPTITDWVVVVTIIVFCYFSFNHGDILATSTHGKDLVICVLQGKFFSFYDYTQSTAVYSIILYIVFAIWSLPILVIYKVFGLQIWGLLDYGAVPYPVLMWYKLLPTLFFVGIAVVIYRTGRQLGMNKNASKWVCFLFVSSPIAIFSQFIFGQYDSIGLFFAVLALYCFVNKKYYLFSIWMSIAITFKLFALFIFMPLLLLFEKRLLHIIKHIAIGMSLYVLTTLMFIGSKGYKDAMAFSGSIADRLFDVGIGTPFGIISIFTIAMIAICVYAYITKCKEEREYALYALCISFSVFAAMFAFVLWHPQWVIYVCAFMSLAILLSPNTNVSLILESVMSVGYIIITVLSYPQNVDANLLSLGAFKNIYISKFSEPLSLAPYIANLSHNLFYSFFAGSLIILVFVYLLSISRKRRDCIPVIAGKYMAGDRIYILARPLSLLLYILPCFYLLIK